MRRGYDECQSRTGIAPIKGKIRIWTRGHFDKNKKWVKSKWKYVSEEEIMRRG